MSFLSLCPFLLSSFSSKVKNLYTSKENEGSHGRLVISIHGTPWCNHHYGVFTALQYQFSSFDRSFTMILYHSCNIYISALALGLLVVEEDRHKAGEM
ncbi:hypothetical protein BDZ97DRAFT_584835 [Flammula alnicola]|nr:hypothetical protein BDZ97DRAFT_584835 [Flammula alnicola]